MPESGYNTTESSIERNKYLCLSYPEITRCVWQESFHEHLLLRPTNEVAGK